MFRASCWPRFRASRRPRFRASCWPRFRASCWPRFRASRWPRFRASRWPRFRERRGGRGLVSTAHVRLNPAWTAGFRGRSMKIRPVRAGMVRPAPQPRAAMPSTTRFAYETSPRPPRRKRHLGWRRKTGTFFKDGFGIDGPSRPRRCPRPALTPGTGPDANRGSRCRRSFS
jgi:hypothetical protein